jgi:hypothetical protein
MRVVFFSDIHGVPDTVTRLFAHADRLGADRLVLLGDALSHGPRNGVPEFYDSPRVAALLNSRCDDILAVRGNCDSEADQQLLDFPIMEDHTELVAGNRRFFLTHGHLWNRFNPPPVPDGTVLAHGHTHIPEISAADGIIIFNPGSITLPKGGSPRSFGFFDGETLSIRRLDDGGVILSGQVMLP